MITDIQSYKPQKEEIFFFDTNIWLYFHSPIPDSKTHIISSYTKFYSEIISAEGIVCTSSHIISEFVNRYLRLDHSIHSHKYPDYKKDYRQSDEYKSTFADVSSIVKDKIIPNCQRIDDSFSKLNINDIFNRAIDADFVDSITVNNLKGKNISILTHDGDFKHYSSEIKILTANKWLIKNG